MNQDLKDAMIVGVDMSKDTFDANEYGEEQVGRFANDKSGIAKFIKLLKKQKKRVVVGLEPSGGYERQLIKALLDAGIEVRFADAFRVRCLAQAHGASAKNDPIDARFVARFIAEVGGRVIQRDETRESLAAILASRRALVEHAQGMMQQAALMEKGCALRSRNSRAWRAPKLPHSSAKRLRSSRPIPPSMRCPNGCKQVLDAVRLSP
jgi:transposase